MKKMLTLALAGGLVTTAAHADVYTYDFGTVSMTGNTYTNVPFTMNIMDPVRGYYITGNWSNVSGTQTSTNFRTNLTPVGGVATGDLRHGGLANTNPFTFIQTSGLWDNSRGAVLSPGNNPVPGGASAGHDRGVFNMDMNGAMNMAFRSAVGTTGETQISNAVGHFLTDAVAPMSGFFGPNSPTFQRPTFLDALHTSGPVFQYATSNFSLVTPGTYLVGAHTVNASTGATFDGMVLLYEGAFDPANPLQNLRGLDDLGGFTYTPSMLIDLQAGDYTMVYTHWSSTAPTFDVNFTGYVAGPPIPEPGTLGLAGLAALGGLARRRRSQRI